MTQSVLVVDDDPVVLSLLQKLIEHAGYRFVGARSIDEACRHAQRSPPDAAIIDLGLGRESGLDLVRLWRVQQPFPTLIVSARSEPIDRIVGLEMGAQDYISKPFEPRELQLRLRIILDRAAARSNAGGQPGKWSVGSAVFDAAARALGAGGRQIELTTAEFRLVDLLVQHPNQALSRDRIMDSVHLRDRHFASDRSVDMLIARLRAKTQSFGLQIKAIRGAGYMLCSPVERLA